MAKKLMDKIKDGVSVEEVEDFARKNTTEVFTVLALIIGAISSMYDYFTGPKLTIIFTVVGIFFGIFLPAQIERSLKQAYSFCYKQEKMIQVILGVVKIVIALFIPFILFGFVGLLAGTSYHFYTHHAQVLSEKPSKKVVATPSSDEHD